MVGSKANNALGLLRLPMSILHNNFDLECHNLVRFDYQCLGGGEGEGGFIERLSRATEALSGLPPELPARRTPRCWERRNPIILVMRPQCRP